MQWTRSAALRSPLTPDVRPHFGRPPALINTSRPSAESFLHLFARLLAALVGSFVGVVATLVAGVAYFALLGTADARFSSAALAAAMFVLPSAYAPALPGAILGIAWTALSPRHGAFRRTTAFSFVSGLAGASVGFWFTYRTPAVPTLSAVAFSALSWALIAGIAAAVVLATTRHSASSCHGAA